MGLCNNCGNNNPDYMIFCGFCGRQLIFLCPHCGQMNRPETRFCGRCGRPLFGQDPPPPPAVPVRFEVMERANPPKPARPKQPKPKQIVPGLTRRTGICQICGSSNLTVYGDGSGKCNSCNRAFM